jgi:hypothetical protein
LTQFANFVKKRMQRIHRFLSKATSTTKVTEHKKLHSQLASINKSDATGCTCSGSLLSWQKKHNYKSAIHTTQQFPRAFLASYPRELATEYLYIYKPQRVIIVVTLVIVKMTLDC